jgi:dihydroorotate dehydrogenase electron transfer subunit
MLEQMKKHLIDMKVVENVRLHPKYCLLKLTADHKLPEMIPGQFVQVRVDGSPQTLLRRPISVNYVDKSTNELWLLIQLVGEGTRRMSEYRAGDVMNIMLPLGNGFPVPQIPLNSNLLLIGGGVGTAPMLYFGDTLKSIGFKPEFLLGARSKDDIMQLVEFEKTGTTYITTEDGSMGEKGFVTNHTILGKKKFDRIYTCGPKPMMFAVAGYAKARRIPCDVSLENMMACGIGACLCCVEKTVKGNVCVCTEGPVFNINQLIWQI